MPLYNRWKRRHAGWSPLTAAAACLSWHRGTDLVTLNGADVETWDDLSGNGRTFGQSNASRRPTTGTLGGHTAITFDAANAEHLLLTGTSYGSPSALHVIRVLKRTADPSAAAASCGLDAWGPVDDGAYPWVAPGIVYDTTAVTTAGTYATVGNPTTSMASLCTYESIATASAFKAKMNGDGGLVYSGATLGVSLATTPQIGGSVAAARYMAGEIAEVMVFSSELGAGDRAGLAAYILARYGHSIT